MTLTYSLWLPALAMAASVLTTYPYREQDALERVRDLERIQISLSLPAPQQSGYVPVDAVRDPAAFATADIWERLRNGFEFPQHMASSVQGHIDTFRNHPRHIKDILQRGEPYLFYILERVEARGMPAELALLPVIESAFDPFSRSPAGAAGIWQFMPATARHVGLQQDWWYDGRRDIVAATEAALDYLDELNQCFDGDWLLTLGAYNAGRARVNKAIHLNRERGQPVDFWHLPLPDETRSYVPKLLALRAVIASPEVHNITLPDVDNSRYFTRVVVDEQLDLQVAARLTGYSVDELQRLNPGLTRSMTPPDSSYPLLIPAASEARFRRQLAQLPAGQRVASIKYRVRWGDTLGSIAQQSRTTVARLRKINNLGSSRIFAGRVLIVPLGEQGENTRVALQTS
jgi:membrane-bound lytic murein transglycosylase D